MLRFIKMVFLAVAMIVVILLSLANREIVTVDLLPDGLSEVYAYSIDLPLFVVSLASIGLGLVLGYVIEYLREGKHRQMARRKRREAEQLANEVTALRKRHLSEEDEVLAILESAGKNA